MPHYDFFNPNPFGIHRKAVDLVGKNKKILEIGCSTGQISRRLTENGCEVIGIEINKESAEIAKEYCRMVISCDIECKDTLPCNDFDFILLLDVLEHLRDPLALLKRLKAYLNLDGLMVVSLPNVANWRIRRDLLLGKFQYTEYGILDKSHLKFFNEKSAKDLMKDAGLAIENFDIVPDIPLIRLRSSVSYLIAGMKPNLLASQFFLVGKPIRRH